MFTDIETRVLNRIQRDMPIEVHPFRRIGDELSLEEQEVIGVIGRLKEMRSVRNIAGIFDPAALGYRTLLAAFQVPGGSVEAAAAAINSHPGVSHNYLRDHRYNLWFTLAEESDDLLAGTLRFLAQKAGATDTLSFYNEKQYKIGLKLNVGGSDSGMDEPAAAPAADCRPEGRLGDRERAAVLILQQDLPLESEPFQSLLKSAGEPMSQDELLRTGDELKQRKYMRRYSAVIRPAHSGFTANAMTVWKPGSDEAADRAAEIFISEGAVTHLYRRTVHPGKWDYPLFAMIHGKNEEELAGIIARLSKESGVTDYLSLKTLRELKKEKVIYFSPAFKTWNQRDT